MKRITLALAAPVAAVALALAGCSSGPPSLHGTYTLSVSNLFSLSSVPGFRSPCGSATQHRPQKSAEWRVRVSADNVYVGSAPLSWQWDTKSKNVACVGTWTMGVTQAQHAYEIKVVFYGLTTTGTTEASTVVQPSQAGSLIKMGG